MFKFDLVNESILDNLHEGAYVLDKNRTIIYWNNGAKRITGYASNEVIGKSCSNNILVHVDEKGKNLCNNLCPVSYTLEKGEIHDDELFLHHKEGHRVSVNVRIIPFMNEKGEIDGVIELFTEKPGDFDKSERINALVRYSFLDAVTELPNRRYIEMKLNSMLDDIRKNVSLFEVVIFEIQNLEALNEKYGNVTTDNMLKMTAKTLSGNLSSSYIAGRWSSGRFLVIAPELKKGLFLLFISKLKALIESSFLHTERGDIHVKVVCAGTKARNTDNMEILTQRLEKLFLEMKNEKSDLKVDENMI